MTVVCRRSLQPKLSVLLVLLLAFFLLLSLVSSACLNACSGNGTCVADSCQCADGRLGADCSVVSSMQPQCFGDSTGSICSRWALDSQYMYIRVQARPNPSGGSGNASGWAGMMFGAGSDGMSGGKGFYVSVNPSTQTPRVVDIYASGQFTPSAATTQTATNITGFANSTSIDVSFQRPLAAVDSQHFAIPSASGTTTAWSVATSTATFQQHSFRTQTSVDIAAVAAAAAPVSAGCPNACSSHGTCTANSCQCEDGRVGLDCSIVATSSSCPYNNDFCFSWTILQSQLYMRVRAAIPSKGWAGLMFHPGADGMSGGQLLRFTPLDGSTPAAVTEYTSTGQVTPTRISTQLVNSTDVAGYNTDSYADISFTRPCQPSDTSLVSMATVAGTTVGMSWAINPSTSGGFTQHGLDDSVVGRFNVDWASGEVTVLKEELSKYYAPIIATLCAIVLAGLILRLPFVVHSPVGRCCLRKRVSSAGANAYAISSKHAAEKSASAQPDNDATLVVQSDDSRLYTSRTQAALDWLDFATLNVCSTAYHMTVGELLVVMLYAGGMIGFGVLAHRWMDTHNIFGHLTAINLMLAVLPVTRRSVWHFAFGISFERAIKWHRFVARMSVVFMLVHVAILIHLNGASIMKQQTELPHGMGALWGTLAGICMLLMALTAFEPIRRRVFELFWYVHVPLFVSTIVFASMHSVYARYYLIAPWVLVVIDWLLKVRSAARSVTVTDSAVVSDANGNFRVGRLTVTAHMTPKAGQYVFINLPAVSLLQWHPFSVSSLPQAAADSKSSTFTLHMLDMGDGTFTNSACNLIAASGDAKQSPIQLRMDGPFGDLSIPYTDYPTLLFVAGGIGFTPIASLLSEVLSHQRECRVYVMWTNRHRQYFSALFPDLLSAMQRDGRFSIHLFDTGSRSSARLVKSATEMTQQQQGEALTPRGRTSSSASGEAPLELSNSNSTLDISSGRPHLPALFSKVAREHHAMEAKRQGQAAGRAGEMLGAAGVGVVVCGPTALLTDVESESMRFGFHLHKETFLL